MNQTRKKHSSIRLLALSAVLSVLLVLAACMPALPDTGTTTAPSEPDPTYAASSREIFLAGGCFWGVEAYMARIDGVIDAISGYANGETENPSYEDVSFGDSGHAETVKVVYDPARITLEELLIYYFKIIDPTSLNRQGNDVGVQYRTGIYYTDEVDQPVAEARLAALQKQFSETIQVELEPLEHFYAAEYYHQDYLANNPNGYCHINLALAYDPVIRQSDYPKPSDDKIREQLTDLQYAVTQLDATEPPYDNSYNSQFEAGIYVDIVTGEPLFSSRDKFHSGTGWPSFSRPIVDYVVREFEDTSLGQTRVEVRSRSGDSHLGHVFEDGPIEFGGLRYCINSAALRFVPVDDMEAEGYGDLVDLVDY